MKVFYLRDDNMNLGDNLNKPILEWLGHDVEYAGRNYEGKLVGIGSIISNVRKNDIVWGAGIMRPNTNLSRALDAKYLAVRGKKTRDLLIKAGANVPEVYGDPALLLPLMYNPDIKQDIEVGYIRHYIDRDIPLPKGAFDINIQTLDYRAFIDQVKRCKKIVSSSLHGLVIAEAYGVEAEWVTYSDRVIGGEFKFRDYLTGTGRQEQSYGVLPKIAKDVLSKIQDDLIRVIREEF